MTEKLVEYVVRPNPNTLVYGKYTYGDLERILGEELYVVFLELNKQEQLKILPELNNRNEEKIKKYQRMVDEYSKIKNFD